MEEVAETEESASAHQVDEETMRLLESENILIYRNYLSLGEIIGVGERFQSNLAYILLELELYNLNEGWMDVVGRHV